MLFHILSDLHLEFGAQVDLSRHLNRFNRCGLDKNESKEINLILAGDICTLSNDAMINTYHRFLKGACFLYDYVFLVAGNHEFYGKDMDEVLSILSDWGKEFANLRFLHNEYIIHNHVKIVGSTLWSYVAEDDVGRKTPINDYRLIKDMTISKTNEMHTSSREFLRECVSFSSGAEEEKKEEKSEVNEIEGIIVITHHLPSYSIIHERYQGSPISCYFASHCDDLIKPPVQYWVYGHTHTPSRHTINGVTVLCNPKGYPSEYSHFSKTCYIQMGT